MIDYEKIFAEIIGLTPAEALNKLPVGWYISEYNLSGTYEDAQKDPKRGAQLAEELSKKINEVAQILYKEKNQLAVRTEKGKIVFIYGKFDPEYGGIA